MKSSSTSMARTGARKLSPKELTASCEPDVFTGDDYRHESLKGFIGGQETALVALRRGLTQVANGHNIVEVHPDGTSHHSVLLKTIRSIVDDAKWPWELRDYCYVYNFDDPQAPLLVTVGAGKGRNFGRGVLELFETLKKALLAGVNSQTYIARLQVLENDAAMRTNILWQEFNMLAGQSAFTVQQDRQGNIMLCAIVSDPNAERDDPDVKEEGRETAKREEPESHLLPIMQWCNQPGLDEQERVLRERQAIYWMERFYQATQKSDEIRAAWEKNTAECANEQASQIINYHTDPLAESYPEAREFLEALKCFVLDNPKLFLEQGGERNHQPNNEQDKETPLPFYVNVYVENDPALIPIVEPLHMTYDGVFGMRGHEARMGTYYTDHTKLVAGALAKANGGVLWLDGDSLLKSPHSGLIWQSLCEAFNNGFIDVSAINGSPLQDSMPNHIPLDVKVILSLNNSAYYLLVKYLPDLGKFFKIVAKFAPTTPRTTETMRQYGQFVAQCEQKNNLPPFAPDAMAKIVEYGSRLAGDREELSLNMRPVKLLAIEASALAVEEGAAIVSACHIVAAISARKKRVALTRERMLTLAKQGVLNIQTRGVEVGHLNGLAVYDVGDDAFGRPTTISAVRSPSSGSDLAITSIDRSTGSTGRIFNKADETIRAIVSSLYKQHEQHGKIPFAISLSFEQSYEGIDGDSASTADICAILSALGNIPLRRDAAVTGSLDQRGGAQAIGGVNQKIEGFFDYCKALGGLAGQAVLIPETNVRHLVLSEEVVEACEAGLFHVYAYWTWQEAVELLTGLPFAEVDKRIKAEIAKAMKGADKDGGDMLGSLWRKLFPPKEGGMILSGKNEEGHNKDA